MRNVVDDILGGEAFRRYDFTEKQSIIQRGRPTVTLDWVKKYGTGHRRFKNDNFTKFKWLTAPGEGPPRLLCWPCLLFEPDGVSSTWTKTGVTDIKNLSIIADRHRKTNCHLTATLSLHHFGAMEVASDRANSANKTQHNQEVAKNRDIMRRLIDVTVFLAKQGLPFRGHDETAESVNRGNYVEALNLVARHDPVLSEHMESSTSFKGVSKDTQNDLIRHIHDAVTDVIHAEIRDASFSAIGADGTTDISTEEQLVTTVRYVDNDGEIQERFMGFQAMAGRHDAGSVAEKVLAVCRQIGSCETKLVSQSYDGASVMSGRENGVRAIVQSHYSHAMFLHCYAHRLNLVLMDGADVKEVKRFFCAVRGFQTFFSRSSKRTALLKECGTASRMVSGSDTRWQYLERAVHVIRGNLAALRQALTIISQSDEWVSDALAVTSARGLLTHLQSLEFLFLLVLYDDIFALTGKLYEKLQSKKLDVAIAVTSVIGCQKQLKQLRTDAACELKVEQAANLAGDDPNPAPRKRRRKEWNDCLAYGPEASAGAAGSDETLRRVHHEALDQCIQALAERFKDHSVLQICELLSPERFGGFSQSQPTAQLEALQQHYGTLFDAVMLRAELRAIWSSADMRLGPQQLLRHLKKQGLTEAFQQTYRLCLLVLTIKPTTVSEERSFSVLKRVKTYLRSTIGQDRLSHLSKLQIEAPLLLRLQKDGILYDSVIERFGHQKERSAKLFFR